MAIAVVCSLAFACSAQAQASGSAGGSSTPVERSDWTRVQKIDADAGTITVEGGRYLEVDKSARVMRDGVQSSLADVQPGDEVRAALHGKEQGPITQVDVRSKGQKKPSY
jgi:Cu/Ag efflux protein CusF